MVKLNLNLTNDQKSLTKSVITRVPRNEAEVKRIFYKLEDTLRFRDVKEFASFPDASAVYEGREIDIEFEYLSSNFRKHGHEERDCDLIVCWEDNDSSLKIRVLELSTLAEDWLKMRRESMMEYASYFSMQLTDVENKDLDKEKVKELQSLMEKYNFDHEDAIAEMMQIKRSSLDYYDNWDDPECVGG